MVDNPDEELFESLLATSEEGGSIDLDRFAEAVAPYGLDADAIDALLQRLEATGRRVVADNTIDLRAELAKVLAAARAFQSEHGRRPSIEELSAAAGVAVRVVRRALAYGRILGR